MVYLNSTDGLSYQKLRDLNKDVIGWIDVYGTKIDYPIVQGQDNAKYLNTTVLGEYSTAGSIFLDYRNSKDFSDFNNIIYGHYMAERKMFGDMEKFLEKDFFDQHKFAAINRNDLPSFGITFFAFIKTEGTDQEIFSPAVSGKENKKALIQYLYDKATFSRKMTISDQDRIVLLDTCDLTVTNGRYILAGVLTEKVEPNPFKEERPSQQLQSFTFNLPKFGLLQFLIIIWILLVIFYLIQKIIGEKKKDAKNDEK
ncbi:SrtB family sortase [Streptococcus sp. X16XC17]|uniref:class B sortase n=1 Tax=unclassified Streptococcus TaxID=2608887 RepID=UPI00066FC249|nr:MULTISPECIES: class B sortase [unclassified Streptococcus]TCD46652.1 SrtB family sortase [Streptococcus sp. X16XC17]